MRPAQIVKLALENPELLGAAAGGAMPAASLAQYLGHDLPTYRRILQEAPEYKSLWALSQQLRTGDLGLAGLYRPEDANLRFLNYGSAIASGGPGSHGQLVGPRVTRYEVDGDWYDKKQLGLSKRKLQALPVQKSPTMWHGGAFSGAQYDHPASVILDAIPRSISDAHSLGKQRWASGNTLLGRVSGYLGAMARVPQNIGTMYDANAKVRTKGFANRGKGDLMSMADTALDDYAHYGKQNRPYLFMRANTGHLRTGTPEWKAYMAMVKREAAANYDPFGATMTGIKSVLFPRTSGASQVPTFQQELARTGGNVADAMKRIHCDATGHHCGSLPMAIGQRMNLQDRGLSAKGSLPAVSLLSDKMRPVGVFNKAQMLKDLSFAAKGRIAAGIGATALGAGGGYLGTKMIGNAFGNRMKSLLSQRLGT